MPQKKTPHEKFGVEVWGWDAMGVIVIHSHSKVYPEMRQHGQPIVTLSPLLSSLAAPCCKAEA